MLYSGPAVHPCIEAAMPINRFRGEFFFLSNFFPCRQGVEFEGDLYPTSEHAYQAAKIEDRDGRDSFTRGGSLGDNPMDAKAKGGKVKKRPDWDNRKVDVMLAVVRSKFARDADLRKKLRATRGQQLVEGHTGDRFWGGRRNHLGNILMRVRDELPEEKTQTEVPDEEDDAETAHPKCKRSKGNQHRRAKFQDQRDSWMEQGEPQGSASSTDEASCAEPEIDGTSSHSGLSETLPDWLQLALAQEITDSADLESAMCAMEVILANVEGDPHETLADAAKMLREDFGAPKTADDLIKNWLSRPC